ncbi:MAG: protein kinase [Chamaesiphon sp.]|nr:protein kinase [Chamaesiphon sp.]
MLPIATDTLLQQRYRILDLLGEGRFGRTYLAVDRGRGDAYCAIEELVPFAQFSSAVIKAKEIFKQEATLLYQLQHAQVPRFWTTVEEQSRLLLIRDYIPGKTYRDLLNDRRNVGSTFSESEVYQFLLDILPVIGYIHSKGTIHRDLCPEHIVCHDDNGLPVPINFGVVKEFANKLEISPGSPQMPIGQPGYAPIEQLQHGQVYPNSDLYTLGVTAIVLLTGKEPSALFEGGKINWAWRQWTAIDDGFANVLSRMFSPQPTDRYQSAIEVEQDLRALSITPIPIDQKFPDRQDRFKPLSPAATVAPGAKSTFAVADHLKTKLTNVNVKSIWEKPQVFIPVGILIALFAGAGSWLGVTNLLRQPPAPEPVAVVPPPKQIDFNNPTIPTDTSTSAVSTDSNTIQLEMDRPIEKEGKVDANTAVRYTIPAIAGTNLDIQVIPLAAQNIDPSKPIESIDPIPATTPSPIQSTTIKSKQLPVPVVTPMAAQVLMTIISPTGSPIDDKSDRVVGWRGQLTASGDYTIELRPIKGLAGVFPYKLSVTQLSVTPGSAPLNTSPNSAGSTTPLGIPIPIGGTGLETIPASPENIAPNNDLPTSTPAPIPTQVPTVTPSAAPTESERPVRSRRRRAIPEQPSPEVRRERVNSTEEAAPRTRRRRRIIANDENTTPTRRNRPANSETQPQQIPVAKPDLGDNGTSNPPQKEDQVPILVPEAKKSTPPASGDLDTN